MAKAQKTRRPPPRIASPDGPQRERFLPKGATPDGPIVLDDLPEPIPVTVRELDTIQIHLGDLIDRLIADAASATGANALPAPTPKARRAPRP
ncbi:hypothetical protein [Bradyrhizobium guangdongense]